jgi:hypothetical protein
MFDAVTLSDDGLHHSSTISINLLKAIVEVADEMLYFCGPLVNG